MYKQTILKNGLRLIIAPMRGTKTATILVMFGTGSKYETRELNGISHFIEHMLFKGTKKRPNTRAIAGELDSVGAEFNAFTSKEMTGYWVKADASKLEMAIDVVSDMLMNSKLAPEEIKREKGTIIEEINMYHDNPMMYIEDVFEECLYGDTPAGREVLGSRKNILSLKRDDFVDYLAKQYSARSAVVCLAGDIKTGIEKTVGKYFFGLPNTDFKDKIPVKEEQIKPQVKIHFKKTNQATISLGVRTFPIDHRDEFALKAMSIILGGSMSSRLFTEVRERRGLAYYVRTQAEHYTDSGYLATQVGVPLNKLEEVLRVIMKEYKKLKRTVVGKKELARTKDLIKGRTTLQLEATDNVVSWYARQAILRKKISTPEEVFKKIKKVTAKDIKRVANDIFINEGLNLAIIGPFKDSSRFRNILNS